MEERIVVYERWNRRMRDSYRSKVKADGNEKGGREYENKGLP